MEAAWVLLLGFVLGAGAVVLGLAVVMRKPAEVDHTQHMVDEIENAPDQDGWLQKTGC